MQAFQRWMTFGMTVFALAGLTAARPARADVPFLPDGPGIFSEFELHFTSLHESGLRLNLDTQDAAGNFTGRLIRTVNGGPGSGGSFVTTPVTGVIAPLDAFSEIRGNFKFSFTERGLLVVRRFEGILQVEPIEPGAAVGRDFCRFFITGTFTVEPRANLGNGEVVNVRSGNGLGFPSEAPTINRPSTNPTFPAGPFPFCATGLRLLIGG